MTPTPGPQGPVHRPTAHGSASSVPYVVGTRPMVAWGAAADVHRSTAGDITCHHDCRVCVIACARVNYTTAELTGAAKAANRYAARRRDGSVPDRVLVALRQRRAELDEARRTLAQHHTRDHGGPS